MKTSVKPFTLGTMTADLLALSDWLDEWRVSQIEGNQSRASVDRSEGGF